MGTVQYCKIIYVEWVKNCWTDILKISHQWLIMSVQENGIPQGAVQFSVTYNKEIIFLSPAIKCVEGIKFITIINTNKSIDATQSDLGSLIKESYSNEIFQILSDKKALCWEGSLQLQNKVFFFFLLKLKSSVSYSGKISSYQNCSFKKKSSFWRRKRKVNKSI